MNLRRGRPRRPDEWPTSHVRARADLAEQLDGSIDPGEAAWLVGHLASCAACREVEDEYATQQLELRALRERAPQPPRDLLARTAAAIENESRFRDGTARRAGSRNRRLVAPTALLATALVVAVAVGTLISSQRPGGGSTAGATDVARASSAPTRSLVALGPTPIPVTEEIEYLVKDKSGTFTIRKSKIDEVCPSDSTEPCDTSAPTEEHPVDLDQDTSTVFGSRDNTLVTYSYADDGTLSVTTLRTPAPVATPTPTPDLLATPTPTATASVPVQPSTPPKSASPSATPSQAPATPSVEPTASVEVTPTPSGAIEIASDVALVGQSAAYSRTGSWFAFTARPIDGSAGPDIYVWKVGEAKANRLTDDHRSVFGSWVGDTVAASTVVEKNRNRLEPAAFLLNPRTAVVTAQAGQAWRPSVDPTGRKAVYWSGTLRATAEPGYAPDTGRLVLGDWDVTAVQNDSAGPPASAPHVGQSAPHETTIAAGQIRDWDARWDTEGTHLAVWIADANDPTVGRLSLYAVDAFDGKIDLKTPLLDSAAAAAGYSISDGKLVWADPSTAGSDTGTIQLLAWSDKGVGTVETITGPAIVIR